MDVSRHALASLSPFIPAHSASKTRVNALMAEPRAKAWGRAELMRGVSFKFRHAPQANLLDSCNENLPAFGIHQICACSTLRTWRERQVRPRPLLFPCYGPVILAPPSRFPIRFPRVAIIAPVFFLLFTGRASNQRSGFGSRPRRRRRASHVFVDRAAGDDGAHHAPFELGLVEGRVLAFRFELGGV